MATRAILRWSVRALLGLAVLAGLAAAVGAAYEAYMARGDAARYPAPGRLIDVGGLRLHLHCTGAGSTTVVLNAGAGGFSAEWRLVQSELARSTRVCAWDRAGLGWSEPGPGPRSPGRIAGEAHRLLASAGERGPFVLVAHSAGGKHVRLLAQEHRSEVSGLVLVDPRSEYVDDHLTAEEAAAERAAATGFRSMVGRLRALGLVRLIWAASWPKALPVSAKLPYDLRETLGVLQSQPGHLATAQAEDAAAPVDNDRLRGAILGDLPLVVLGSRLAEEAPYWRQSLQYQAALSTNSRLTVLPRSDHCVHWDDPAQVVAAVRDVVQAGVAGQRLSP